MMINNQAQSHSVQAKIQAKKLAEDKCKYLGVGAYSTNNPVVANMLRKWFSEDDTDGIDKKIKLSIVAVILAAGAGLWYFVL